MIVKTFSDIKTELQEGSREVISVITTDAIDRDNEVVLPKGLKKKNHGGNPVVLFNHDYKLPVGVSRWIKADPTNPSRLIAKTYISDKTQTSRDIWGLIQDGVISAVSVGFQPLEAGPPTEKEIKARPELAKVKRVIRSWELFEYSFVSVPANQEALVMAVAKGYCPETIRFLNGGRDYNPSQKDCWEWDDQEEIEEKVAPIIMPKPLHCRSLDLANAEAIRKLTLKLNQDEILLKYLGRV